jgi:tRNA(adenine34) deaminase
MSYRSEFMERALELAKKAYGLGEVPVGAVVVRNDAIVGEGYNMRESKKDPTAHAEMIAIRQASESLGGWRLHECDMYVTLEPCVMCSGAIINSRIRHVYIGTLDKKRGSVISNAKLLDQAWTNHRTGYTAEGDKLKETSSQLLSDFFKDLRGRTKA